MIASFAGIAGNLVSNNAAVHVVGALESAGIIDRAERNISYERAAVLLGITDRPPFDGTIGNAKCVCIRHCPKEYGGGNGGCDLPGEKVGHICLAL